MLRECTQPALPLPVGPHNHAPLFFFSSLCARSARINVHGRMCDPSLSSIRLFFSLTIRVYSEDMTTVVHSSHFVDMHVLRLSADVHKRICILRICVCTDRFEFISMHVPSRRNEPAPPATTAPLRPAQTTRRTNSSAKRSTKSGCLLVLCVTKRRWCRRELLVQNLSAPQQSTCIHICYFGLSAIMP